MNENKLTSHSLQNSLRSSLKLNNEIERIEERIDDFKFYRDAYALAAGATKILSRITPELSTKLLLEGLSNAAGGFSILIQIHIGLDNVSLSIIKRLKEKEEQVKRNFEREVERNMENFREMLRNGDYKDTPNIDISSIA